ncbi:MAG TPA: hypothetical protein PKA20_29495 [Burkholderiaceae bacterium]|nr:hypothetical protein [Burkholderiaceae bacterium]
MHELELDQVNASLPELDAGLPDPYTASYDTSYAEPDTDLQDEGYPASSVFSLTSLIDSSAAEQAAERLYASNLGGVRFFSELNRAMPRARAMQTAQRLESVALAEGSADSDLY